MKYNDLLIFNLHRRYLNVSLSFGGFSGIYLISAFVSKNGFPSQAYAGDLIEGKKLIDRAYHSGNVRVIGLYCDYENVTENIYISNYVKNNYNIPVIVGGPQATSLGKNFIEASKCDAIVCGEGELTVLELLEFFLDAKGEWENIKGIAYVQEGRYFVNPERELIENLDLLPFVDKKYSLDRKFREDEASIMTGRGCPFNCSFCFEGRNNKKVRFRSVSNVLDEVDKFLANMPKSGGYLIFTDDTFTLLPERVEAICSGLKERKKHYNFGWYCEGHVHTLYRHPEMIDYIASAGAHRIQLGIEAGTQELLDYYRKGCTVDEIFAVIRKCKEVGISQIFGNIIIGGPFFNKKAFEDNWQFVKKIIEEGEGAVELGVVSYWPLPETSITKKPYLYGLAIKDYNFYTSVADFPQAETVELDIWHLCLMMKEMRSRIKQLMRSMLRENKIPIGVIRDWFYYYNNYHTLGLWMEVIINDKILFNYYDCIFSGEAEPWINIKDAPWSCHPMRLDVLCDQFTWDDNQKCFFGIYTDPLELELIRYSVGKLSISEIIETLKEQKSISEKIEDLIFFEDKVLSLYEDLDKRHLIVFSRF